MHLAGIGFPVVADEFYSPTNVLHAGDIAGASAGAPGTNGGNGAAYTGDEILLSRQALHAHSLRFVHPITRDVVTFEAPLAEDMQRTLDLLRGREAQKSA